MSVRNVKALKAKMEAGENFSPSDFGAVVAAGKGDPDEELKKEMAAQYNMQTITAAPAQKAAGVPQPKFIDYEPDSEDDWL